jgi:hypothetical protein
MNRLKLLILFLLIPLFSFSQVSGGMSGGLSEGVKSSTGHNLGVGFCSEYRTVHDAFTTAPDLTRARYYNTAVQALVDGGYWARMDIFRLYANHTNGDGEALINWINPGTYDATAYNSPTWTIDQGFQFNGTDNYIDQNWVPSVSGVNYTQNSASQVIYVRTNIAVNVAHGTANNADSKDAFINPRNASNNAVVKINATGPDQVANSDGSGLFINTRTAAAVNKLYRNGVAIINGTTNSTGVPTHSPYTGAYNDDNVATGFRADEVAIEIWMDGCTQADVTAITTILNTLMTSLGTNVFSPNLLVFLIMLSIFIANRKKFRYEKDNVDIDNDFRLAA